MFISTRILFTLVVTAIVLMRSKSCHALKQGNCLKNFVQCGSGECIRSFYACDGAHHCSDRSDESHAVCHVLKRCPAGSFRCAYGGCIDNAGKCNGIQDCSDNSDERLTSCPGFKWLTSPAPPCSNWKTDFQCRNGECILRTSRCDGEVDCSDRSDESIEACYDVRCPVNSFQCAYGGCISLSDKCNEKMDCADGSDEHDLLCNRTHVKFCTVPSGEGISFRCRNNEDSAKCILKPNDLVKDQDIMHFHCEKGFITNEAFNILHCSNEMWNRETASLCIRTCPLLESSFIDFSCIYKSKTVNCSASPPGTVATAVCKEGYYSNKKSQEISCLSDGQWEKFDHSCKKICGILDPEKANDESSLIVRHPWNVGIYVRVNKKYKQFCSGTLISPLKVITAANCMINQHTERERQLKKLIVTLGKFHKNFHLLQEENVQVREIVEFNKPENYKGIINNYYNDVAILKLKSAVEINNHVMPICIDKSRLYSLSPDNTGSIVGWNLHRNYSNNNLECAQITSSEDRTLQFGQLPYMPRNECLKFLSSFLTFDKFCAFSPTGTNVTSVCKFDSGAGLTFKINDVHYIYGIVSTLVNFTNIRQTTNFINTFTDLTDEDNLKFIIDNSEHEEKIEKV